MADTRLVISNNLAVNAVSQYTNYDFKAMVNFKGRMLAFNEDGIYVCEEYEDDDGTDIFAYFETPTMDWNILYRKHLYKAYMGYSSNDVLQISVKAEDGSYEAFSFPLTSGSLKDHMDYVYLNRRTRGRYFQFKISNTNGCDFSVNALDIVPLVL